MCLSSYKQGCEKGLAGRGENYDSLQAGEVPEHQASTSAASEQKGLSLKRAIWAAVITVPFVALLAFGFGRDPSVISSPLLKHRAPSFTLKTIEGKTFSLERVRGEPIVLNFWASWCLGCRVEHPYLLQAWKKYGSEGVAFVGVVYQDTASDARGFMKEYGGDWPSVMDPGGLTAINYGVVKIPETYFIDRDGIVQYKSAGQVTPGLLKSQIELLLRTPKPK
jgi:cytochrome c biogenesis protein CcmG, thiol:disulfide interchange protein DsbE